MPRLPFTGDETDANNAADVVDSADTAGPMWPYGGVLAARVFWWLAHHTVARPLATAFPVRHMFRFCIWTAMMLRR